MSRQKDEYVDIPDTFEFLSEVCANELAIASLLPENTSHWAACSRELPTPFCAPATITSKPPSAIAPCGISRWPLMMSPAYAFFAISRGS